MNDRPNSEYPFRTTDKKLAFALAVSGCQWAPLAADGPATNTYSIGFMRQRRFEALLRGMKAEEAAKKLHELKQPGTVEYVFIRDAVFFEAIGAYDELIKAEAKAREDGRAMELPHVSAKDAMTVFFAAARSEDEFAKVPFVNRMRQMVSTISVRERSESLPNRTPDVKEANAPGARTVREGSGKVWSIFGSQQLKDDLHVS